MDIKRKKVITHKLDEDRQMIGSKLSLVRENGFSEHFA